MTDEDWNDGLARSLAVYLNGRGIATPGTQGEPILDDDLFIIVNAAPDDQPFVLPEVLGDGWQVHLDTGQGGWLHEDIPEVAPGEILDVVHRSLILLTRHRR